MDGASADMVNAITEHRAVSICFTLNHLLYLVGVVLISTSKKLWDYYDTCYFYSINSILDDLLSNLSEARVLSCDLDD